MLISSSSATTMVWGISIGVAVVAAVGAIAIIKKDAPRIFAGLLALIAAAALAAPITKFTAGTRVLVVRDGGIERMRLYGSDTLTLSNQASLALTGGVRTIVINDRAAPAALERVRYGTAVDADTVTEIAPFSMLRHDALIRFVGRDDPPPRESTHSVDYWLRW